MRGRMGKRGAMGTGFGAKCPVWAVAVETPETKAWLREEGKCLSCHPQFFHLGVGNEHGASPEGVMLTRQVAPCKVSLRGHQRRQGHSRHSRCKCTKRCVFRGGYSILLTVGTGRQMDFSSERKR